MLPRLSLRRGALASALALAAVLLPAAAQAAPSADESLAGADESAEGTSVALLPVRFADPLPEADERELEAVIATAFDHPDLTLIEGAKVERARSDACPGAVDEACLRGVGAALATTHVVELVVHAQDRDFDLEFRVLRMSSARAPNVVEVQCQVCGVAEVRDRVAAQAVLLRDRLLVDTEPGRVIVAGTPAGAKLSVDGRRVGELPFEGELSGGEHELLVSARGYYDRIVPVNVGPGTVEQIEVELERELTSSRKWQRPTGWSLVGVGGAGMALGIALLVLDGRPSAARCDDPANLDINGDCRWIYQTGTAGISVLSVGIAAASVGATMLALGRASKAPKSAKSARARARARSLSVGFGLNRLELSGRF